MVRNALPGQEVLRELFDYNNGSLYWRVKFSRKTVIGKEAGGELRHGYRGVRINGIRYFLHRLVWQWHYGHCPDEIDHKDGNPANNEIDNLRPLLHNTNLINSLKTTSSTKSRGVYPTPAGKYVVQLRHKHIGTFESISEASAAYEQVRTAAIKEEQL